MTILPHDKQQILQQSEDWRWLMLVVRRALLLVVREIERRYGVRKEE